MRLSSWGIIIIVIIMGLLSLLSLRDCYDHGIVIILFSSINHYFPPFQVDVLQGQHLMKDIGAAMVIEKAGVVPFEGGVSAFQVEFNLLNGEDFFGEDL